MQDTVKITEHFIQVLRFSTGYLITKKKHLPVVKTKNCLF